VPSSGGRSIQRNVDATQQSSYDVAFTEVIKTFNIKILKCIKLIIINLQCCNINTIKSIKISRSSCCSFSRLYGSCIQRSMSIVCRDRVLVERIQCLVSNGGETCRGFLIIAHECILFIALVCWCNEYKKMHGMIDIKCADYLMRLRIILQRKFWKDKMR
jgi:hypothetical protein